MALRARIFAQARRIGLCGISLIGVCCSSGAFAQEQRQEQRVSFDIPAQPLAAAIDAYGNITGRDLLYNSTLTTGRRSTAVFGVLPVDTALFILLEGTGLAVRHGQGNSYALLTAPPVESPPPITAPFLGRLQDTLRGALCADRDLRPGGYRVAVRFWVGNSGDVIRYQRLSSTGVPGRDAGLDRTLRRLRIGQAPPAGLQQPVTLLIAPEAAGLLKGCAVREAGAR